MTERLRFFLPFLLVLLVGVGFYLYYYQTERSQNSSQKDKTTAANAEKFVEERGKTELKRKQYLPLVAVYQKMLASHPDNIELKKKLAFAHFGAEQYDQALPLLEEISKTKGADAETDRAISFIYSRQKKRPTPP